MQSREARYTVVENTAMLYAINNATTTNNDNNTEDNVYVQLVSQLVLISQLEYLSGVRSESQTPQLLDEQMSLEAVTKNSQGQWCCHHDLVIARVHLVHAMNAEQRQVAADLWTNPHRLES